MKSYSVLALCVCASLLKVCAVSSLLSLEESEVEVIPNPHAKTLQTERASSDTADSSSGLECSASTCTPSLLLSPHRIIRRVLSTQSDTLVGIEWKKVLGVPVPVYQFRQPARLSTSQLPFKLILVSNIDNCNGLSEIPTDPVRASDSWFLGYRWTPVVCSSCEGHVHVGWKFVNPSGPEGDFFFALIVEALGRRNGEGIIVGTFGEKIFRTVEVGVRAPGWMISSLAKVV